MEENRLETEVTELTDEAKKELVEENTVLAEEDIKEGLSTEDQKKIQRYLARMGAIEHRRSNKPRKTKPPIELRKKARRAKNRVARVSRRNNK